MCGRYRLSRRRELLAEYFDTNFDDLEWEPRYNVAPTQSIPVLRQGENGAPWRASLMRWGLIPNWATDSNVGAKMINARSETAAVKPSFKWSLQKRRCLVPADGFYEWKRTGKTKQPYCFEVGDGELFAFAGLWDAWRDAKGQVIETCTILTTSPNDLLADVHDRMPVILAPDNYELWLDARMQDENRALAMLKPFEPKLMKRHPVSTRVNYVANDDAECAAQVELAEPMPTLFG
jgi:putative SOS response-associated peptidase YedK